VGRGNEAVYAARVALKALELAHPHKDVREFVHGIRKHLLKRTWMCCGEFIVSWHDLCRLPLASAYVLETILAFGIDGINITEKRFGLAQIVNPHPRIDECNGGFEEQRMMGQIATAIPVLGMVGKPPHLWTVRDIDALNAVFSAPPMDLVEAMPEQNGSSIAWENLQDRVLPSTQQIFEAGWIDMPTMRVALADSLPKQDPQRKPEPPQPIIDNPEQSDPAEA